MRASTGVFFSVECYAGHRADERPIALRLGARRIAVREILDRWRGEDHTYFKLLGEEGAVYLIRQDQHEDRWELILFEHPRPAAREFPQ